MLAEIKASSMLIGRGDDSSVDIAAKVAKDCIEKSGVNKKEIGLFLNVGIHRDQNIVEPAVAALIQKKVNLNLNPTRKQIELRKGTLSFDIIHGTCGFIHALQTVDAFFKCGTTNKALIVSSDVHPSGKKVPEFPYTPSGAAMLLESSNNGHGFKNFMFQTSKDGCVGVEQFCDTIAHGNNARNIITVEISDNYVDRLKEFTLKCVKKYIKEEKIDLSKVKHMITSTPSKTFGREIADALGFRNNTLVEIYDEFGDTNTSALIIGYHIAAENSMLKKGEQILFISGGSGLSCACAVYEV